MIAESDRTELGRVLLEMLDDLPAVAERLTRSIRDELPEYVAVPFDEHVANIQEQQAHQLRALLERRLPDGHDLRRARDLGRRRAAQGLPVQSVIGAFHVGNRELWQVLRERAPDGTLLADVPELMWETVHLMTSALAAAHAEASRALHAHLITMRYRLFELLAGESAGEEAAEVALGLGLRPDGAFMAACAAAPSSSPSSETLDELQRSFDRLHGSAYVSRAGGVLMVLWQDMAATDVFDVLHKRGYLDIGAGLCRHGLVGAAESLRDAHRALAAAQPRNGVRYFAHDWLRACLLAEKERLSPLVADRLPAVRANEHLAAAVVAFAESGFSVPAAAGALNLHSNTAAYRLDRWKTITGWDVRRFDELLLSLLAVWVVSAEPRALDHPAS